MQKEVILFIVSTVAILLALLGVCGTCFYLYVRDEKMVRFAISSVKGRVVGYSYFQDAYPPIVEYMVDGKSYKKTLKYFMVKTVSLPWAPVNAASGRTRAEFLEPSITFRRNSLISIDRSMREHFPIGSEMTVWYDPEKPTSAFVERYCGVNKFYKWFGIGYAIALVLIYSIVILIFLSQS